MQTLAAKIRHLYSSGKTPLEIKHILQQEQIFLKCKKIRQVATNKSRIKAGQCISKKPYETLKEALQAPWPYDKPLNIYQCSFCNKLHRSSRRV